MPIFWAQGGWIVVHVGRSEIAHFVTRPIYGLEG